ncbi:hypothetical protein [Hymenobacter baengnokdamensis]|uniref:hypothetical protein n=1 Tax=Hymenobacter baengnokdamensis TaxID=2615203 RepID=UPI00124438B8|nr:hypothetical protein [Hymenobacter baengnokdamensis]
MPRLATPPAAPTTGAAQPEAAQRARIKELLARLDKQAAPSQRPYYLAPPSAGPLDEPATDPCHWQGFL